MGKQHVAQPSDVLQVGDVVMCAATRPQLEKLRDLVGVESSVRLDKSIARSSRATCR